MFNDIQPCIFPASPRVIVIGDVHGDIQRFMACLYALGIFNQKLEWTAQPQNTIVVQLGDQVDSASRTTDESENWEVMPDVHMLTLTTALDNVARVSGGRVISLLGNHEVMNIIGEFTYVSQNSRAKMALSKRAASFQPGGMYARMLAKRNVVVKIGSHLFCHGGLLPHHLIPVDGRLHLLNELTRMLITGADLSQDQRNILTQAVTGMQGILWTRMYVELAMANSEMLAEAVGQVLGMTGCTRIYCGHNTVPCVSTLVNGSIYLVDAGLSRAYGTKRIQLIEIVNMDTPSQEIRTIELTPQT